MHVNQKVEGRSGVGGDIVGSEPLDLGGAAAIRYSNRRVVRSRLRGDEKYSLEGDGKVEAKNRLGALDQASDVAGVIVTAVAAGLGLPQEGHRTHGGMVGDG